MRMFMSCLKAVSFGMTCLWRSRGLEKGMWLVSIFGFEAVPQSPHVKKGDNLSATPSLRVSVSMETAVSINMTFGGNCCSCCGSSHHSQEDCTNYGGGQYTPSQDPKVLALAERKAVNATHTMRLPNRVVTPSGKAF